MSIVLRVRNLVKGKHDTFEVRDPGSECCLYLQSNLSKLWFLFCKLGKGPDAGKDWGQQEKGSKENEMVGWHHQLNGHESEQTLGAVKDREAWHAVVHVVTKNRTRLSELNNMEMKEWVFMSVYCNLLFRFYHISRAGFLISTDMWNQVMLCYWVLSCVL